MSSRRSRRHKRGKLKFSLPASIKKIFYIFLIIFVFLVMIIGFYSWHQWKNLSYRSWRNFSIVVQETKVDGNTYVVTLDTVDNTRADMFFASELKIPVAYGYGEYRAEVVPDLGKQDGFGLGLLSESLTQWLAIDTADVIRVSSVSQLQSLSMVLSASSTMNFWERIWFWKTFINVPTAKTTEFDLVGSGVLKNDNGVLIRNELQFQEFSQKYLLDTWIASHDIQVVVVNGTNAYGLASEAAETLLSIGYDVVAVQDTPKEVGKTRILAESTIDLDSEYTRPLQGLFLNTPVEKVVSLQDYRGDVVILLGEDYAQLLGR